MRKNTLIAVTAAALAAVTLTGCTTANTTTAPPSAAATTAPTETTAAAPTATAKAEARLPVTIDGAGSASLGTATIDISDDTLTLTDATGAQVGPVIPVELAGEVNGPVAGDIAWISFGDAGISGFGGHYWDAADNLHRVEILEAADAPTLPADEGSATSTSLVIHADPDVWDGLGSVDKWIYGDIARGSLKLNIVD